jgi:nucleoporin NDC1
VTDICLAELRAVIDRINAVTDPNYRGTKEQEKNADNTAPIQLVPQISQPLRDGQIAGPGQPLETRLQKIENVTSQIARTHSNPQNLQNSLAKKGLDRVQQEANDGKNKVTSQWEDYKNKLARSPIGYLVRHSLPRTASVVTFGTPYARRNIILNAITILTNLSVCSLKEDAWGNYQNVVPDIVRVFSSTITKIESYLAGLEIHWTDVDTLAKPEAERRKVAEVEEVVGELKVGLEKILRAFGEYLEGLGMSAREVIAAKKLVAREVPEMRQAR